MSGRDRGGVTRKSRRPIRWASKARRRRAASSCSSDMSGGAAGAEEAADRGRQDCSLLGPSEFLGLLPVLDVQTNNEIIHCPEADILVSRLFLVQIPD